MTELSLLQKIATNPAYMGAYLLAGYAAVGSFTYALARGEAWLKGRKGSHLESLVSAHEMKEIEKSIQKDLHTDKKITNINEDMLLNSATCITAYDGYLNLVNIDLEGTPVKLIQKFSNNKKDLKRGILMQRYLAEVRNLDFVPRPLSVNPELGNISYFIPSEKRDKKIYDEDLTTKRSILEGITEDFFLINEPFLEKGNLPPFLPEIRDQYVIEGSKMIPHSVNHKKYGRLDLEAPDLNMAYDLWSFIKFGSRKNPDQTDALDLFGICAAGDDDREVLTSRNFIPHTSRLNTELDDFLKGMLFPLSRYLLKKPKDVKKESKAEPSMGSAVPELQDFLRSYCDHIGDVRGFNSKFGRFVSHGDPHSNNILYDGKKVHILDWDKCEAGNFYRDIYGFARALGLRNDQSFRELVKKRFAEKGYDTSEVELMENRIEFEEDLKYGFKLYHATKRAEGEEKRNFERFASYYVTQAARKLEKMGATDARNKLEKLIEKRYGSMGKLNDKEMQEVESQRVDEVLYDKHLSEYFGKKNPSIFTEGSMKRRKESHGSYIFRKDLFNSQDWAARYVTSQLAMTSGALLAGVYYIGSHVGFQNLVPADYNSNAQLLAGCAVMASAVFGFNWIKRKHEQLRKRREDYLIGSK